MEKNCSKDYEELYDAIHEAEHVASDHKRLNPKIPINDELNEPHTKNTTPIYIGNVELKKFNPNEREEFQKKEVVSAPSITGR